MVVRIRMKKLGRRHRPYYRICVMDGRSPRDGKAIEEVGTYDPMILETDRRVTLKSERIDYWISVGAQPSEKVARLLEKYKGNVPETRIDQKVERAINVVVDTSASRVKRPKKKVQEPVAEAPAAEAPAEETPVEGAPAAEESATPEAPAEGAETEPKTEG